MSTSSPSILNYKTKRESVTHSYKSHRFKTATIKILSADFKHGR